MPKEKPFDFSQPLTLKQLDAINLGNLTRSERLRYWAARGTTHLKGKTVSHVEYISDEEMRECEWNRHAPVVVFTDGSMLVLLSDNEGNGPGAGRFAGLTGEKPVLDVLGAG